MFLSVPVDLSGVLLVERPQIADVFRRVVAALFRHASPALADLIDDCIACDHLSLTSHQFERRAQSRMAMTVGDVRRS